MKIMELFNSYIFEYLLIILGIVLIICLIILINKLMRILRSSRFMTSKLNDINTNLDTINNDINKVNDTINNSLTPFIQTSLKITLLKTLIDDYKDDKTDRKKIVKHAIGKYQKITALKK